MQKIKTFHFENSIEFTYRHMDESVNEFISKKVKQISHYNRQQEGFHVYISIVYIPKDEKQDKQYIETLKAQQEQFIANKNLAETQQKAITKMIEFFNKQMESEGAV